MIFKISRTSGWPGVPPCEEAVKMENTWSIKIDSIADLIRLSEKYGELILKETKIEIHDTYRE